MSGHSRWAGIKHKKAAIDAKRGKVFTKIIREIVIAAKTGGGKPEANVRLRKAMEDARAANMPQDNIKKAVQRGTGELPGVLYEELVYEGYGPSGVAMLVEVTTDNKNRSASEIRKIFSVHGGNMGESGCVSWMFSQHGVITVERTATDEDALITAALDAGAEDVKTDDDEVFEVITQPHDIETVKDALKAKGIAFVDAAVSMVPQTYIALEGKPAEQMMELMEELEDNDDVQHVYANFDIPKEMLEKY